LKPHPYGGALVQTVTGILVDVSSAVRIYTSEDLKCPILILQGFKSSTV
jgi:hypothetical protein